MGSHNPITHPLSRPRRGAFESEVPRLLLSSSSFPLPSVQQCCTYPSYTSTREHTSLENLPMQTFFQQTRLSSSPTSGWALPSLWSAERLYSFSSTALSNLFAKQPAQAEPVRQLAELSHPNVRLCPYLSVLPPDIRSSQRTFTPQSRTPSFTPVSGDPTPGMPIQRAQSQDSHPQPSIPDRSSSATSTSTNSPPTSNKKRPIGLGLGLPSTIRAAEPSESAASARLSATAPAPAPRTKKSVAGLGLGLPSLAQAKVSARGSSCSSGARSATSASRSTSPSSPRSARSSSSASRSLSPTSRALASVASHLPSRPRTVSPLNILRPTRFPKRPLYAIPEVVAEEPAVKGRVPSTASRVTTAGSRTPSMDTRASSMGPRAPLAAPRVPSVGLRSPSTGHRVPSVALPRQSRRVQSARSQCTPALSSSFDPVKASSNCLLF
ncbi:hypothetical protein K523DRAFT_375923 [Schizophyllum commune Tattone D]|nr:hypothetical protein K523DRAFT_375923 [Schizophyllum commune Tattone D]